MALINGLGDLHNGKKPYCPPGQVPLFHTSHFGKPYPYACQKDPYFGKQKVPHTQIVTYKDKYGHNQKMTQTTYGLKGLSGPQLYAMYGLEGNIYGLGDMDGFFSKLKHYANPVNIVKDTSHLVGKGISAAEKGVTSAGLAVGKTAISAGLAPLKIATNLGVGLSKMGAHAVGGILGTAVKGVGGTVGAVGKGFAAPFKGLFGHSKSADTAAAATKAAQDAGMAPPPPPPPDGSDGSSSGRQYDGSGVGYGTTPAAGGGASDVQAMQQALDSAPGGSGRPDPAQAAAALAAAAQQGGEGGGFLANMSTPMKLGLAGVALVGVYFAYKKFGGRGSGRSSKR